MDQFDVAQDESGSKSIEKTDTPLPTRRRWLGQLLTVVHVISFTLAAVVIKKLPYLPFSLSAWRFQGLFLPSMLIFFCHAKQNRPKSTEKGKIKPNTLENKKKVAALLIFRAMFGTGAVLLYYYALQYIPISDTIVITSTEPVLITLLAHLCLGEPCGLIPVILALLSTVGILIVSRPPLITGAEHFDVNTMIGLGFAVACLTLSSLIAIIIRYLRSSTRIHFAVIMSIQGVCGSVVCAGLALATGAPLIPTTTTHVCLALLLVASAFIQQISYIFAMKYEAAGPVSIIRTTGVIFSFLWEILFFARMPDVYSLVGAGLVLFCVTGTMVHNWAKELPEGHNAKRICCTA